MWNFCYFSAAIFLQKKKKNKHTNKSEEKIHTYVGVALKKKTKKKRD